MSELEKGAIVLLILLTIAGLCSYAFNVGTGPIKTTNEQSVVEVQHAGD